MTNEEARVIQTEIQRLSNGELALRRAVRERQSNEFKHNRGVMGIIASDINALDQEANIRGLAD